MPRPRQRVFFTGGSGFIGRATVAALQARGDSAVVVSRDVERAKSQLPDRTEIVAGEPPYGGDWQGRMIGCDAVINLAGEPMDGRRWNTQFRQVIHDSRVDTTRLVVEALAALPEADRPRTLLSGSGVDYYPADMDLAAFTKLDEDDDLDETTLAGDSFLSRVCRDWEAEAKEARAHGVRVVTLRTGLVLGRSRLLSKMTLPFKFFVGGRLGSGRQWMSWIHIEDVVGALLFALDEPTLSGPINLVAPEPVRNRDFARSLGRAMGRPSLVPVPKFALKLALGELAEYAITGRRAVPRKLVDSGYEFRFPGVDQALSDLL